MQIRLPASLIMAPQVGFEPFTNLEEPKGKWCVVLTTLVGSKKELNRVLLLAPQVGFEPTTYRLTAECSTTELLGIVE